MASKILTLDIETKPALVYAWRAYGDQNHTEDKIVHPTSIICVGAKWLGSKEVMLFSDWGNGKLDMLAAIHALMSEADAIITYNGDKFDLPILMGEFLMAGFDMPPPLTSIDLLKTVRKMGFFRNNLAFIGPYLGVGAKVKHEGFNLWSKVMEGDEKAQLRMAKYCRQDVRLTEKLYLKIRGFIKNHPHLGDNAHECGNCESNHVQKRGYRRTKYFKIQRVQCQSCGAWADGQRQKIK